jgi:hypothetical protein
MRSPVEIFDEVVEQSRRIADLGRRVVGVWRDVTSLHAEGLAARARDHARVAARHRATPPTAPSATPDPPQSATGQTSRSSGR